LVRGLGIAFAMHDDRLHAREELLRGAPRREPGQVVAPEDQEERRVLGRAEQPGQLADRVDRERGTRALELDPVDGEARLAREREAHHLEPVLPRDQLAPRLVRWLARRHEDDLIEVEGAQGGPGRVEVARVDRVEGTSEDPETGEVPEATTGARGRR